MPSHSTLLVLFAAFQISTCQGPPPLPPNLPQECLQPPRIDNPRKCCDIPPIFSKEDFGSCGFKEDREEEAKHGPPECTKQICLLKTHNLAKDDETVDQTAMINFIDKWTDANPDFKPTAESAKAKCLGKDLPGPPEVCEANKIVFCISSTLFMECPKWKTDIEECQQLKNHIDTCSKYFPH